MPQSNTHHPFDDESSSRAIQLIDDDERPAVVQATGQRRQTPFPRLPKFLEKKRARASNLIGGRHQIKLLDLPQLFFLLGVMQKAIKARAAHGEKKRRGQKRRWWFF